MPCNLDLFIALGVGDMVSLVWSEVEENSTSAFHGRQEPVYIYNITGTDEPATPQWRDSSDMQR